jgi:sarcosine oxidase subunit alpha
MSGPFRHPDQGSRIDRARPLAFTFDGRRFTGFAGDTVASALMANGVTLLGRSFKYHRPRGLLGAGVEEPNALIEVDRGPGRRDSNLQATTVELVDGLVTRSQNRWPSLGFDVGAVNSLIAPLIPAGFYYKTFLGPRGAWERLYEPAIRRAAGLGRPPTEEDPDRYGFRYQHCETLVIGGGPAGLGAALAASEGGGRVILCDEDFAWGGRLNDEPGATIHGQGAPAWLSSALASLRSRGVELLARTTAFIHARGNMVGLAERIGPDASAGGLVQRWRQVRAGRVIIATGGHQRPVVFPGNDRPGVMLASAAAAYLRRWGAVPGRQIVVLDGDGSGRDMASDLVMAGASVAVLDLGKGDRALRSRGGRRVTGLEVQRADGRRETLPCDAVLMAGGWTPTVNLWSQAGGKLRFDMGVGAYVPQGDLRGVTVAGGARGLTGAEACLEDGLAAGRGEARGTRRSNVPAFEYTPPNGTMAFVDFQNDVTVKDIRLAVQEGFASVEHLKRYTTTGMATDQGRTSNVNAMAAAGQALGIPTGQVGVTTFRPPSTPTVFGMLCGHDRGSLFEPERRTPIDPWAQAQGAIFEPVSAWRRARAFPRPGETLDQAVSRECRTVRAAAGVFDASTLGKIEVVGPDAAEFLERMYVNAWKKLGVGRCRYGLLLREDGFVFDDGVVGRLAADRFHVTTTTGGASGVLALMEDYRQTEFPELRVWLTSTTEQWAVIAVQGPRARDILSPLVEDCDLSAGAMPHMSVRQARVAGVPGRLFRVSFTGELGFEVNVPAGQALQVWEAVWAQALRHDACVYGTDAMHLLRAEKGYIIVGQETDGTVTPDDLGLGWAIGKAKRDFVGKRSLARPEMAAPGRKHLVGLRPLDPTSRLEEGAQLTGEATPAPFTSVGHVTSAYMSDAVGGAIALALLKNGRARVGQTVFATRLDGPPIACAVTTTVFVDPQGALLDA